VSPFAWLRCAGRALLPRSASAGDIDEALRSHLLHRADDLEHSGLPRAEAERRARIEFGAYQRYREESHEALGFAGLDSFLGDLRFSLRTLMKSPGVAITAILTLALAIGANAVVFAVLNGLILRPLNLPQAASLYGIEHGTDYGALSYPNYVDIRDRNRSFQSLAACTINRPVFDTGNNPTQAWTVEASGNYFDALQIRPFLGRFFHASDEHGPNSAPWVVLSWAWWHSHFHDDRSVIGRKVLISRRPFTVIGVTPPSFQGTLLFFVPDMFVPMVDAPEINGWDGLSDRSNRWVFESLGHLRPGVTPTQAAADLDSIGVYLEKTYPGDYSHREFRLINPALYGSFLGNPIRGFVTGLMLLAGLILLAACANLGSLFAARASDRSREVALRLALGSSRRRIVRQLMTEALLISVAGGTVGVAISVALLRRLSVWRPLPTIPVHLPVTPDARVYLVALLLALVSGVLFGLVPVRQVLRADPWEIVKAGSGGRIAGKSGLRDTLLVVQIAVCALMVTSSLVALRGLLRSLHANFGFDPQHVVLAQIDLSMAGYHNDQVAAIQKRILDTVRALPGVKSAATTDNAPLIPSEEREPVYREEAHDLRVSQAAAMPFRYIISPDYFEAAGTPLLAGRAFTQHDDLSSPRVAIVNEQFARGVLGSASGAIGRYFRLGDGTRVQVVGLVPDGKYLSLTEDPQPAMFVPVLQKPWGQTTLVVRGAGDPQALVAPLRNTLRGIDPGMSAEIHPWTEELDYALFGSRVTVLALSVLGLMGLMLAATGIFGMASYAVSQRMRELGIRMALGAQRTEILETALGRALRLLALGSAAGLVLGILASRGLAFLIYEPSPGDPLVLAGVGLTMLLLGLIAAWIPAHRAISIDPLALLREE